MPGWHAALSSRIDASIGSCSTEIQPRDARQSADHRFASTVAAAMSNART
jgi:hypothetical protein